MGKGRIITDLNHATLGKMVVESTFDQFPEHLIDKVSACMAEGEPFALSCDSSVVVFLPRELAACWYDSQLKQTVQQCRDIAAFTVMMTSIFYTHHDFMGPLLTHQFVIKAKLRIDERERAKQLSDTALPESVKPSGSLETGGGGI